MHRTIGQTLRAAREARELSLLDVAHLTRIPAQRIQQLEDDNFAAFGSMAYAKSFLKKYSRFLDVDATEVIESLPPPMLGGPSDYRYLLTTHGPWVERPAPKKRKEPLARTASSPVPTLVGMFVIFIIGGALFANHLVERHRLDGKTPPQADGKTAEKAPETVGSDLTKTEPKNTIPEVREPQPETVMVRAAVLPKSIPAPVTPNTPVRRAEIIKD